MQQTFKEAVAKLLVIPQSLLYINSYHYTEMYDASEECRIELGRIMSRQELQLKHNTAAIQFIYDKTIYEIVDMFLEVANLPQYDFNRIRGLIEMDEEFIKALIEWDDFYE